MMDLSFPTGSTAVSDFSDQDEMPRLIASGCPETTTEENARQYFSNIRKSGGGKLQMFSYDEKKQQCSIIYEDPSVTARVLAKKSHKLEGQLIHVEKASELPDNIKVMVSGFSESTDEDTIQSYFSNKEKSGGGTLASFEYIEDEDSFHIEFESNKDPETTEDSDSSGAFITVSGFTDTTEEQAIKEYWLKQSAGSLLSLKYNDEDDSCRIEFENKEVVRKILSETHTLDGSHLNIREYIGGSEKTEITEISVSGFAGTTDEMKIKEYFSSCGKSGGGPIASCTYDEENDSYLMQFENNEDLQSVLKRPTHTLEGHDLTITILSTAGDMFEHDEQGPVSIIITGFAGTTEEEDIKHYFSDRTKSGGGPIDSFQYDDKDDSVHITFKHSIDLRRLLQNSEHKLEGNVLEIKVKEPVITRCKLRVERLAKDISEDDIESFFSNVRRSGGGLLETCMYDEDTDSFIITFQDDDVARRVAGKSELKLRGTILKVSLFFETLSTLGTSKPDPGLLVCGLDSTTTEDSVEAYFSNVRRSGGGPVKSIEYQDINDGYFLQFQNTEVIEKILSKEKHVLDGAQLIVERSDITHIDDSVTEPKHILKVAGIPSLVPKEEVVEYFSNVRKSGGGPLEKYVWNPETGCYYFKFMHTEVMTRILRKEKMLFKGDALTLAIEPKFPMPAESERVTETKAVIPKKRQTNTMCARVSGFNEYPDKNTLTSFFQNKSRSGGGPIDELKVDPISNDVIIKFKNSHDADALLMKHSLTLCGCPLIISALEEDFDQIQFTSYMDAEVIFTVRVTWDGHMTKDTLELLFETPGRTGGGPIKSMHLDEDNVALISYEDPSDAQKVYYTCKDGISAIGGVTCWATLVSDNMVQSSAVKLDGIPRNMTDGSIINHIENPRHGWGEIDYYHRDEASGTVYIAFKESDAATSILSNAECKIDDVVVKVSSLKSKSSSNAGLQDDTVREVLCTGLPRYFDKSEFIKFLESQLHMQIASMVFSSTPGAVIVRFVHPIDIAFIMDSICSKPFYGSMIHVEVVEKPGSVHVAWDIPVNKQMLELYFEKHGGKIDYIKFDDAAQTAVITYSDPEALLRENLMKTHKIDNASIEVTSYYRQLGRPNQPTDQPAVIIPDDVTMKADLDIIYFLHKSRYFREIVEGMLKQQYGKIVWPGHDGNTVTIHCDMDQSTPDVATLSSGWAEMVAHIWIKIVSQIKKDEISVLADVLDAFKGVISNITTKVTKSLQLQFRSDGASLIICGLDVTVRKLVPRLSDIHDCLVQDLQRRLARTEDKIVLPRGQTYHLELLTMHGSVEAMRQEFPDTEIDIKSDMIFLAGPPDRVAKVKSNIQDILAGMAAEIIIVNPGISRLMKKVPIQQKIMADLKKNNIMICISPSAEQFILHAINQESATKAKTFITGLFGERVVSLNSIDRSILGTEGWKCFIESQLTKFEQTLDLKCNQSNTKIYITSFARWLDDIEQKIQHFIAENSMSTCSFTLNAHEAMLVKKHLITRIKDIGHKHKHDLNVKVVHTGTGVHKLHLDVRTAYQKAIETDVQALKSAICHDQYRCEREGMVPYIKSAACQKFLSNLQEQHQAIVDVNGPLPILKSPNDPPPRDSTVNGQVRICVISDNITKRKVDVIVNVSGEMQSGRLTEAILKAAGTNIQEQWKTRFIDYGERKAGQAFYSGPGNLISGGIIHVIAPEYNPKDPSSREKLSSVINISLDMASGVFAKTIALPFIGRGQRFPKDVINRCLCEILNDYVKGKETTLECIEIVEMDNSVIQEIKKGISQYLHVKTIGPNLEKTEPQRHMGYETNSDVKNRLDSWNVEKNGDGTFTVGNLTIDILCDSIASQSADAIVAPFGAVSKAILQEGGTELSKETKNLGNIRHGAVMETEGFNLKCRYILHCTCPSWHKGHNECKMKIEELLKAIFNKAEALGCSSVLIPAIGTGRNGVPPEVSADILLSQTIRHARTGVSVKRVTFVIYKTDQNVLQAFKNKLNTFSATDSCASSTAPDGNSLPLWDITDTLSVSLVYDDIINVDSDVIVCTTDKRYPLKSGAAKAISFAAGRQFYDAYQQSKENMTQKHMVILDGGNLQAKYVIVMAAMRDEHGWSQAINSCLEMINNRSDIRTASFLALGTGGAHANVHNMAKLLLGGIKEFAEYKGMFECKIRLVFTRDRPEIFNAFKNVLLSEKENATSTLHRLASGVVKKVRDAWHATWRSLDEPVSSGPEIDIEGTSISTEEADGIHICAANKLVLKNVKGAINNQIDSEYEEIAIKNLADLEIIAKLAPEADTEIKHLRKKHQVLVCVDHTKGIIIKGYKDYVMKATIEAKDILQGVERDARVKAEALANKFQVQWYYQENNEYEKYEDLINAMIERAYQKFMKNSQEVKYVEWTEGGSENENIIVRIHFDKMVEEDIDTSTETDVKRVALENVEMPAEWEDNLGVLEAITLKPDSKEYKSFLDEMNKTSGGASVNVTKIERIQNKTLFQQYQAMKTELGDALPSGTTIERRLWHGCSAEAVAGINKAGFDRSYHGKNGTAIGKGAYFARDFSYSNQPTYSRPDTNGEKRIYLCTVLTGEFTTGSSSMMYAPLKSSGVSYDSVVNNTSDPSVFVIFRDSNAYPSYLMTYK